MNKTTMRTKIGFGKYKDRTFLYVTRHEPSYIYWLMNKTDTKIPDNIYEYIVDKRTNKPKIDIVQGYVGSNGYDYIENDWDSDINQDDSLILLYEGDGHW
jgi:hypothetical protein